MPTASSPPGAGYAVVDLETTGLYPSGGHDRIVEIGIVALDPWIRPVDEWTTLVNPCRDVGPTSIHGITASQVVEAPLFSDVMADLLGDRVVVGHNVRFDLSFLDAEFGRAGYHIRWMPGLCTLWLASSITGARRLDQCCASFGIDVGPDHSALGDARAAAALLDCCFGRHTSHEIPPPLPRSALPPVLPSGRSLVRRAVPAPPRSGLASLADRLPMQGLPVGGQSDAVLAYVDLLDRLLEDRRLTSEEVAALAQLAAEWGISGPAATAIHRSYFSGLAQTALAEGILTDVEREDLREDLLAIAERLGVRLD